MNWDKLIIEILLHGDVVRFTSPWTKKKEGNVSWCGQSPPHTPISLFLSLSLSVLLLPLAALCDSAVNNQNFILLSPVFVSNFLIYFMWSMIVCCCDTLGMWQSEFIVGKCCNVGYIGFIFACHKRLLLIFRLQLFHQLSRSCFSFVTLLCFVLFSIDIYFVCLTYVGPLPSSADNFKHIFIQNREVSHCKSFCFSERSQPVVSLGQPMDLCCHFRCQTAGPGSALKHNTGCI